MQDLSFVRNRLRRGQFGDEEKECLRRIDDNLSKASPAVSRLIRNAIRNCLSDVEHGDFDSAILELQLVHDLPIQENGYKAYDEKYFYSIELLNYVDKVKDYLRTKTLIALLSDLARESVVSKK